MNKRVITSALALLMLLSITACDKKGQTEPNPTAPAVHVDGQSMSDPITVSDDKVFGRWEAESGLAIEINADKSYAYFLDKSNTSDNYYKGSVEMISGPQAIAELKMSLKEYLDKYDQYAGGYHNVFSLKLKYETFQSEGADKSDTLDKSEYMPFLFVLSKDNEDKATLVNMSDSTSTEITRVK